MHSFNRLGLLNAENSQQNFSSWVSYCTRDLFVLSTIYAIIMTSRGPNLFFLRVSIHITL